MRFGINSSSDLSCASAYGSGSDSVLDPTERRPHYSLLAVPLSAHPAGTLAAVRFRLQRFTPAISLLLVAAGVALAVYGQRLISQQRELSYDGPLVMALGGGAFLIGLFIGRRPGHGPLFAEEGREDAPTTRFRLGRREGIGLALAVVGGLGAFQFNDANSFTVPGLSLWIIGALGLVWGIWQPGGGAASTGRRVAPTLSKLGLIGALLLILSLATFFRFYDLDGMPKEMRFDHSSGILAIKAIADDYHPVFFVPNREPLFLYASKALVPFLDYSYQNLKVLSAFAGLITVAATYGMTRELFRRRGVALMAAAFTSISYWHLIASRLGFRRSFAPPLVALTLLFLFRALKSGRRNDFLLCGLLLGAGLYADTSLRVLPLAVGLCLMVALGARLLTRRGEAMPFLANTGLLVLAFLVVGAPMLRFAVEEPDLYWARSEVLLNPSGETPSFLHTVPAGLKDTLLMFNWQGENTGAGIWSLWGSPQLDYVTGAVFALGAAVTLVLWTWGRRGLFGYAVLVFFFLLIPSIADRSTPGSPGGFYASSVIPLVAAIAALPLYLILERAVQVLRRKALLLALPIIAVPLGLAAYLNWQLYFDEYATAHPLNVPNQTEVASVISEFAESGGSVENAYLKLWGGWVDHTAVAIEMGEPDWQNWLTHIEEAAGHSSIREAKLYVVFQADAESLRWLQEFYPRGRAVRVASAVAPRLDFYAFAAPRAPP